MATKYTTRFRAYAAANGYAPDDAPTGWRFMTWINAQWRVWDAEHGYGPHHVRTDDEHRAFDAKLSARYLSD